MEIRSIKTPGFIKSLFIALLTLSVSFESKAEDINIVTTNTILADITSEVTGKHAVIYSLVGYDEEVHAFNPKPSDLKKLKEADIIIANGKNLEGWLSRIDDKNKIVEASKGIKSIKKDGYEDPHGWNSPYNANIYIDNIAYAACAKIPAYCNEFKDNANKYKQTFNELTIKYKQLYDALPQENKKAITAHDAFGYLARDFEITFIPIKGVNEETEISAQILAQIIKQIRESGIKVIFIENISNTHFAEQLTKETSATIGGELISDSLSKKNSVDTYYKMVDYNLKTVYEAFSSAK
jgi:zinc/manganese transport system substrate-binding protein